MKTKYIYKLLDSPFPYVLLYVPNKVFEYIFLFVRNLVDFFFYSNAKSMYIWNFRLLITYLK